MKQKISTLLLGILFINYSLLAQVNKTIPDPDFINQIYLYDSSLNLLKSLEKTTAEFKGKAKALGFGGGQAVCQVKGKFSTVQLSSATPLLFVVQLGQDMADPALWFQLYKADVKGNKREATYTQEATLGGTKKNNDIVKYDVKKIRDKVYQFTPAKKLEKGEYFFLNKMSSYAGSPETDVFCFAVN